jgi:phosphohistidine phosphatase
VWVLRHAKAAPQGRDDHTRPLTARGRRQATEVGTYLGGAPVPDVAIPELVLSSSARRAVQTAELVVAELGDVELVVERRLYAADPDDVVDILRALGSDPPSVLVVGHNPTVHELAAVLLDGDDGGGRSRLERGFPTAALAVIAVEATSWTGLSTGTGTLLDLHTPEP